MMNALFNLSTVNKEILRLIEFPDCLKFNKQKTLFMSNLFHNCAKSSFNEHQMNSQEKYVVLSIKSPQSPTVECALSVSHAH